MSETCNHSIVLRQSSGGELDEDVAGILNDIFGSGRIELAMQHQVDNSEAKLAHLRVCASEVTRSLDFLEQIVWNALTGLVVTREKVDRFAFHAPVLHDLGG